MRRFEFSEGNSNKFWEVEQDNQELKLRWGKLGTQGQSQTKTFADNVAALAAMGKLIKEKTGKGYVEVSAPADAPPSKPVARNLTNTPPSENPPTNEPLENALPTAPLTSTSTPPWLTDDVIALPPDLLELAIPSRQYPKTLIPTHINTLWNHLHQKLFHSFIPDFVKSEPAWQSIFEEAVERLKNNQQEGSFESDQVILLLAFFYNLSHQEPLDELAVDYLVAKHGIVRAIETFLATEQLAIDAEWAGYKQNRILRLHSKVSEPISSGWRGPYCNGEWRFRWHLAVADQNDWENCVQKIRAALPYLHPTRQPLLALLLPELPEVSNDLAIALSQTHDHETAAWLQLTATDPQAIKAIEKARNNSYYGGFLNKMPFVVTLVRDRGLDALPVLESVASGDTVGDVLVHMGAPAAVKALARVAGSSKTSLARFSEAIQRWPSAALVAIMEVITSSNKENSLLSASLRQLLSYHEDQYLQLKPYIGAAAQQLAESLLAKQKGPTEVADPADLPRVLANPPWLSARKKIAATISIAPLTLTPTEHWSDGTRENALALSDWQSERLRKCTRHAKTMAEEIGFDRIGYRSDKKAFEDMQTRAAHAIEQQNTQALIECWQAFRQSDLAYYYSIDAIAVAHLPDDMAISFWNTLASEPGNGTQYILAKHGLKVLPGLLAALQQRPTQDMEYALSIGAVELAAPAARAYAKLKTARNVARQWLLRYPEYAACGLIAAAIGKPGEARDCAATALRLLLANGHEALIMEVADRYQQPEVTTAVRAMLDEDPLERCPTKIPKMPDFWQPRAWSRPLLVSNGKALGDEALEHIGTMLRFPTSEGIYAGIDDLKSACTRDSLANFIWDCFSAWLYAGAPSKEGWAMTALGLLGNDETARRLTPYIRSWPGESQHARAVNGLDVLASIGSDVALMLLNGIAQKVKFKGLQDRAREKIDQIAQARELTTEELEDRLAPDLGLDHQGTLMLDFGPRRFKVGFDETLKPYVRDEQGARLADLPKPKKTDDAALSQAAVEQFKLLKKDARTIASQQVLRLETAMCSRRRWTPEVFRQYLAEHPLVRHLVQRLVWGVYAVERNANADDADTGNAHENTDAYEKYGGQLLDCFRVAEDGSFTTADDDAYTLPAGAHLRIGIPHALELPSEHAASFGQLFADYELLQPFAQIGRDTYTLTPEEHAQTKLLRWKGAVVPTGRVLGLANKGWRRGDAQDGGGIWYFTKNLGGKKIIELNLDPGIIVGMVDEYPEQTLQEVSVGTPSAWGAVGTEETFTHLDPISASELIRDMESLRA